MLQPTLATPVMHILVDLPAQRLTLFAADGAVLRDYAVSTAARGCGEQKGSFQTPRGRHVIRAMIGAGLPSGAVLKGRRPTGEICMPERVAQEPQRDWILSRILWLSGCQPGFNRLGERDTMRRYIYIHGTPDSEPMGEPRSHGCIRMRNAELIELFDLVKPGTVVVIRAEDSDVANKFPCSCVNWRLGQQAVAAIRMAVPEIRGDEQDDTARHLLIWNGSGEAVACARLSRQGYLGAVGVMPAWRGHGLGQRLLEIAVEAARETGWKELRLFASAENAGFFARQGFEPVGDRFDLDGVLHQAMRRFL